jgi:molybdopterin-guanine dinucleotide biosynthesis protein B
MKVVGFVGYSGAGKTTLIEQVIKLFRQQGLGVSVIKHAHEGYDVDRPGKDSYRHREAGAYEVLLASRRRMALLREWALPTEPKLQELIPELGEVDWVLVEGFKFASIPKLEIWRADTGKPHLYEADPFIVAVVTCAGATLPAPTQRPVLDIDQPELVAAYLLSNAYRFEYVNG